MRVKEKKYHFLKRFYLLTLCSLFFDICFDTYFFSLQAKGAAPEYITQEIKNVGNKLEAIEEKIKQFENALKKEEIEIQKARKTIDDNNNNIKQWKNKIKEEQKKYGLSQAGYNTNGHQVIDPLKKKITKALNENRKKAFNISTKEDIKKEFYKFINQFKDDASKLSSLDAHKNANGPTIKRSAFTEEMALTDDTNKGWDDAKSVVADIINQSDELYKSKKRGKGEEAFKVTKKIEEFNLIEDHMVTSRFLLMDIETLKARYFKNIYVKKALSTTYNLFLTKTLLGKSIKRLILEEGQKRQDRFCKEIQTCIERANSGVLNKAREIVGHYGAKAKDVSVEVDNKKTKARTRE